MKAILFVLLVAGGAAAEFDTAAECNKAAIEALADANWAECRGYDENGDEVVFKSTGEVTYVYPRDTRKADFVLEIK